MKIKFVDIMFYFKLLCNKYYITPEQIKDFYYVKISNTAEICYSKTLGDLTSFCDFTNNSVTSEYGLVGNTLFHKISVNGIVKLYRTYDKSPNMRDVPIYYSLPYEEPFGKVSNVFKDLYFEVDKEAYFYYLLQGNEPLFDIKEIK